MNLENARRLITRLPSEALVLDVGGGASPFPRADYVIDALPFEAAGAGSNESVHRSLGFSPRYSHKTWVQHDLCSRTPLPFSDRQFDFVVCSHLLEDVRDPIGVCGELMRVGKAGYIEVPSRIEEQSLGVEHPLYAGYYHHRWLISNENETLVFRHKPHNLHSVRSAIVMKLKPGWKVNPDHAIVTLEWNDKLAFEERLEFSEAKTKSELIEFAQRSRQLPLLCVPVPMSVNTRLKRHLYFWRLERGRD